MKKETKREVSNIAKRLNEILDTYNPSSATPPPSSMAGGTTLVPDETGNHPQMRTDEQTAPLPPQVNAASTTPPTTAQSAPMASDVRTLQKATSNANTVNNASKRINTATEFPQAFKLWFGSLGYKPENPAISIMRVRLEIEKAMREMGYK
jgi:hypothetical protein